jgi:hypothetical protein
MLLRPDTRPTASALRTWQHTDNSTTSPCHSWYGHRDPDHYGHLEWPRRSFVERYLAQPGTLPSADAELQRQLTRLVQLRGSLCIHECKSAGSLSFSFLCPRPLPLSSAQPIVNSRESKLISTTRASSVRIARWSLAPAWLADEPVQKKRHDEEIRARSKSTRHSGPPSIPPRFSHTKLTFTGVFKYF